MSGYGGYELYSVLGMLVVALLPLVMAAAAAFAILGGSEPLEPATSEHPVQNSYQPMAILTTR